MFTISEKQPSLLWDCLGEESVDKRIWVTRYSRVEVEIVGSDEGLDKSNF